VERQDVENESRPRSWWGWQQPLSLVSCSNNVWFDLWWSFVTYLEKAIFCLFNFG
jgi:hypothetical protein